MAKTEIKEILNTLAESDIKADLLIIFGFPTETIEEAQQTLDFLEAELNAGHTSIDIYNPEGWNLNSWPQEEKKAFALTKGLEGTDETVKYLRIIQCVNNGWSKCICLCKENSKSSCEDNGYCINNPGYSIQGGSIDLIDLPITLSVDQNKREIALNGSG